MWCFQPLAAAVATHARSEPGGTYIRSLAQRASTGKQTGPALSQRRPRCGLVLFLTEHCAECQEAHGDVERGRVEEQLGGRAEARRLHSQDEGVVGSFLTGGESLIARLSFLGQGLEEGGTHSGK